MTQCTLCGGMVTQCARCRGLCNEPVCAVCSEANPLAHAPVADPVITLPSLTSPLPY